MDRLVRVVGAQDPDAGGNGTLHYTITAANLYKPGLANSLGHLRRREICLLVRQISNPRALNLITKSCYKINYFVLRLCFIPWVAAQAVRWPGIPKVARSRLTQCSKSCDLQPALHCAIRGAQGVFPCVGWGCDQ